ncbi:hypothetical protein ACLI4Z_18340 [Natrialbaceae archaeon A-arb3/5]
MKWRCTWCGKPHEENDPPCDNCGHNVFEEAVVRADEEPSDSRTVDTGTTYVWKCRNCGREHVKNNPPCSRCGNPELEKTEQLYADVDQELETSSWLEVAKPYTPIFVLVGVVIALFATGIISPSMLPGIGTPSPPDAPGDGSQAAGIDLEAAEDEIHQRLESERAAAGADSRAYDEGLAAYAAYQNHAAAAIEYEDAEPESVELSEFDPDCGDQPVVVPLSLSESVLESADDETELAEQVATALLDSERGDDVRAGYGAEGVDLYSTPDDVVYVFYLTC